MREIRREQILIRSIGIDDVNFIMSSWLRSYRQSPQNRKIRNDYFFPPYKKFIEAALQRQENETIVICPVEEPQVILGFLNFERVIPEVLNFIYVKYPFRGMGLAALLLKESQVDMNTARFTHWTYDCEWIKFQKFPNLEYDPYFFTRTT